MIEALARIRNDSVLSRPGGRSALGPSVLQRAAERARALPPRVYVGAILSALLVGIGVNALVLQRGRHPAPLFAPAPQKIASPAPVAPLPPPAPVSAPAPETSAAVASPPPAIARPASNASAAPRLTDAIGEFLREGDVQVDNSRLVKDAQVALAKLGYPVKADGAQGAGTDQALREFERAHGLPVSTEITPHLVKQLNAATRAAAR
jgi:Putative peptidoglycan binding domain